MSAPALFFPVFVPEGEARSGAITPGASQARRPDVTWAATSRVVMVS
ncbi:MAG: hypothetical protein AB1511_10410 [Deinococcota bacterium]